MEFNRTVVKKAYAKINLTLEILGKKRNDGYHDIATVMHKIPLHDTVSVSVTETCGIDFYCDKNVCEPKQNLAYRAALLFLDLYKQKHGKIFGVSIRINKNIPAGAGLAGGSTNAAAVLDALFELCGGISKLEISSLALSLGSDVPFCLEKHACSLCTGRGEIIEDIPKLRNIFISVIFPNLHMPTSGIYSEYDKIYGENYGKINSKNMAEKLKKHVATEEVLELMCNDFEPICETRCGKVSEIRNFLKGFGAYAGMSGSGSAVFGIFLDNEKYILSKLHFPIENCERFDYTMN